MRLASIVAAGTAALLFVACASVKKTDVINIPTVAYPFDRTTLAREDVVACSEKVLELGWFGMVDWERAAFLKLEENGRLSCQVWDSKLNYQRVEWRGRIPDGTVAVIHSHPRTKPDPSEHDVFEAQRLGIPVIVVTPEAVVMTLRGETSRIVRTSGLAHR